ncbi:hypothetical protein [Photobacterium jeanii]|uniref:hypothetical protein n=1 Tax=Photobacterium jeanii TaxID=858640 RepID=UPI000A47FD13
MSKLRSYRRSYFSYWNLLSGVGRSCFIKATATTPRYLKFFTFIVLLTTTALSGCGSSRHQQLSELGFTRPYLDGYQDGCHSRKEQAVTYLDGFRQDPERMLVEPKYANGWQDGYEQCYANNLDYY